MSSSILQRIPTEVLQGICDSLDSHSLLSFAFTNKKFNSIANAFLFQRICIDILSRKQLQLDIEYWSRRLTQASSLKHVRWIDIAGKMPCKQDDNGDLRAAVIPQCVPQLCDNNTDLSTRLADMALVYAADNRSPQETLNEDDSWEPIASFIRQLPALVDLDYACSNQFPPCLLKAIHQNRPECRLHLRSFRFRSLNDPEICSHEIALASSPCLYSIAAGYYGIDSDGEEDFNQEAIFQMVSCLAPRLQEVSLCRLLSSASIARMRAVDRERNNGRKTWRGFPLDKEKTASRLKHLTKLELRDSDMVNILTWSKLTDYSKLCSLHIRHTIGPEVLSWFAVHQPFSSLQKLYLFVDLRFDEVAGYDDLLSTFIRSLPPLKSFTICANPLSHDSFKSILEHHGKTLRKLSVETFGHMEPVVFDASLMSEIHQNCPILEDLTIPIRRSMGDKNELTIYKTLGALPRLQKIVLTLDASDRTVIVVSDEDDGDPETANDPTFNEFEKQFFPRSRHQSKWDVPRNGHVRKALVNSALDESLARAIFNTISANRGNHHTTSPLNYLQLHVEGAGFFGWPNEPYTLQATGIFTVIKEIARSWELVRNPRDDCHLQDQAQERDVIAREIPRKSHWLDYSYTYIPGDDGDGLNAGMELVFRKLWPERGEEGRNWSEDGTKTSDWRNDWYSFPLSDS